MAKTILKRVSMSSLRVLSGTWKGHILRSPLNKSTRPTKAQVRAAIFNIWKPLLDEAHFLDLFSGSGAIGLEALSLGANRVSFVENNLQAIRVINENKKKLGCELQSILYEQSVENFLAAHKKSYQLIFIDPPYDWSPISRKKIFEVVEPGCYVGWLLNKTAPLLTDGGQLIIEQAKRNAEDQNSWSSFENITYLETREYGDSLIHRFEKLRPASP
jgi:16S rRNA (guanine966-N2)-methyltransferase